MIRIGIKDKLISNTIFLSMRWVSNTLLFMLFWLILGNTLPPEEYGIVSVALQVVTLLAGVCSLGLTTTARKLIPEFVEKKQWNKVPMLVRMSLKITTIFSLLISLALIVFYLAVPSFIKFPMDVLWLVGGSIIMTSLATILMEIYYGLQDMKRVFWTRLISDMSLIVISLSLIFLGMGYIGAVIAYMVSSIILTVTQLDSKILRGAAEKMDSGIIKKYAIPALIVIIFTTIFNNSQFIILSTLDTVELTGIFAVAMKIASPISIVPTIFSTALFPITSGLSLNKKSKSRQSYLITLVFRYSIFVIIPASLFILFFSDYIIVFFSSVEYLSASAFLPILVIGGACLGLANQFLLSLYATGHPKKYRDSYVISTVIYLVSAVVLTYMFSAHGLAFSYLLSSVILLVTTFLFIRKTLCVKVPLSVIWKISLGCIMSMTFLFFTQSFVSSIWSAIPFILMACLVYLAVLLKLGFYVHEDLKVLDFVSEKIPMTRKYVSIIKKRLSNSVSSSYYDTCL